jgi:hypothetical protein
MRPLFTCLIVCCFSLAGASASTDRLPPPSTGPSHRLVVAQAGDEPQGAVDLPSPPVLSRRELCEVAATAAETHGLPVPFFIRLIWQESRFDTEAVSPAGAQGVAQFMPQVAAELGLLDPFHPIHALFMSARFLRTLLERFGNLGLAAAAYNAGTRRVLDWLENRGQLPKETRRYVHEITGLPPSYWTKKDPPAPVLTVPERTQCAEVAAQRAPTGLDGPVGAVASGLADLGRSFARLAAAASPKTRQKRSRVALGTRSSRTSLAQRGGEGGRIARSGDRRERRVAARHAPRREHVGAIHKERGKLASSSLRGKRRAVSTASKIEPRPVKSRSAADRRSRTPSRG